MTTATRKRAARKAPAKRAPRTQKTQQVTDKMVREWAVSSGIQGVQMRGRVSAHLVEAYHAAGGVVQQSEGKVAPAEAQAKLPVVEAQAPTRVIESMERQAVYIITSPTGERVVLKPDAVYVEEILIDDSSSDAVIESLARLSGLPKSDVKTTLVRTLSGRLTELVSA